MIILMAMFSACGEAERAAWVPERDDNFALPAEVLEAAPRMQEDLRALIRYPSAAFQIKPDFVFLDEGKKTVSPLQAMVARLHLLHLALWRGKELVWSGSVMLDPARGAGLNTQKGRSLDVVAQSGNLEVVLGPDPEFRFQLNPQADQARWQKSGDYRLFSYWYRFPEPALGPRPRERNPGEAGAADVRQDGAPAPGEGD
jgi:hypothetical protein